MTDKELLGLAAKAAGVPLKELVDRYDRWEETPILIGRAWNPLTNDSDALRLAIKMGISIETDASIEVSCDEFGGEYEDGVEAWNVSRHGVSIKTQEIYGKDRYGSTRRAIVRAAAEMGAKQTQSVEQKQSEIFCVVDFVEGMLAVSVLRRRSDDVAELIHFEKMALPAQTALEKEIVQIKKMNLYNYNGWEQASNEAETLRYEIDALKEKLDEARAQPYNADPSCMTVKLSEMILSDCGCSSNDTALVSRVVNRIDAHIQAVREPVHKYEFELPDGDTRTVKCLLSERTQEENTVTHSLCVYLSDK